MDNIGNVFSLSSHLHLKVECIYVKCFCFLLKRCKQAWNNVLFSVKLLKKRTLYLHIIVEGQHYITSKSFHVSPYFSRYHQKVRFSPATQLVHMFEVIEYDVTKTKNKKTFPSQVVISNDFAFSHNKRAGGLHCIILLHGECTAAIRWEASGVFDFFIDNTKTEKLRIAPITYIYN